MSKLTIVGLHGDRTGVLDALIKMGGVEVIEDKAEGESTRSMAYASNLDLRARLKRAISGLSARFPEARHLVGKKTSRIGRSFRHHGKRRIKSAKATQSL